MSSQTNNNAITDRLRGTSPIAMETWRRHDAPAVNITGTAGTDDLGLLGTTYGTDSLTLQTSDGKATTIGQLARVSWVVPPKYKNGTVLTLRVHAGMVTTISDDVATVDASVRIADKDGGVGDDLVTTAATTINSLTKADVDFVITPTAVNTGDVLDILLTIAITDAATGTAVIGEIGQVEFVYGSEKNE